MTNKNCPKMADKIIKIKVGAGYDVLIGQDILAGIGESLLQIIAPCSIALITDSNVERLYLPQVKAGLEQAGFIVHSYSFPAGENSKNMTVLGDILEFMAQRRLTRSDLLIALGGGVVGDIAGLAAGLYQRGLSWVQLPTTLLAAIDSSIGGKTAVNLPSGKNLAGVFHQPKAVFCDIACLTTLSEDILADGEAEAIKYGLLMDRDLFEIFAVGKAKENLGEIMARCIAIKGHLVEEDELDNGNRRFLNLGHTLGHAIEKCSSYTVSHGQGVAIGMVMIARAGEKLALTKSGLANEIAHVLASNGLPIATEFSVGDLLAAALADKKRSGEEITLVFPRSIGDCLLKTLPVADLEEIITLAKEE